MRRLCLSASPPGFGNSCSYDQRYIFWRIITSGYHSHQGRMWRVGPMGVGRVWSMVLMKRLPNCEEFEMWRISRDVVSEFQISQLAEAVVTYAFGAQHGCGRVKGHLRNWEKGELSPQVNICWYPCTVDTKLSGWNTIYGIWLGMIISWINYGWLYAAWECREFGSRGIILSSCWDRIRILRRLVAIRKAFPESKWRWNQWPK